MGGGIFTVINELYNSKNILNSAYNNLNFWGYQILKETYINSLPNQPNLYDVPLKKLNKFMFSRKMKMDFISSIKKNDIIHIHSLWLYLSIISIQAQKIEGVKKIISVHGALDKWALNNGFLKKLLILKLYEQKNLNTTDCIHALCEQEYDDIRKITLNSPIAVIPNGVNLPLFFRDKNNSLKETKTLLFLGRIHPKKGLINLFHAWSKVKLNNWKLLIVGPEENNHLHELIILSKKLKIDNNIEFIGPKFGKEKEEILRNADALVLPSYSEGLPMAILEAWANKIPVLMTPECNFLDGFTSYSALKVNTTVDSIAEGLRSLNSLSNEELKIIGENGYKLVQEKYTWDVVSAQWIELYDWVSGKITKPSFVRLD